MCIYIYIYIYMLEGGIYVGGVPSVRRTKAALMSIYVYPSIQVCINK